LGAQLDWNRFEDPADAAAVADLLQQSPDNFWALHAQARAAVDRQQWLEAVAPLERLIELYPEQREPGCAYELLAEVHRQLDDRNAERRMLEQLVQRSSDSIRSYLRLMEIGMEVADWRLVMDNAERMLAVNPLLPDPHRYRAVAAEHLGDDARAIESYRRWLLLDPIDPAGTHYRLARLLKDSGQLADAKRHTLQALEEAPRYREAHRLLLDIVRNEGEP
jgi:tetratricopeptide (TPR) repeat protein